MANVTILPVRKVEGVIEVPGDKSISHRAVMLSSIAEGTTAISNFLMGEDCLHTIKAFKQMGIKIVHSPWSMVNSPKVIIEGKGLRGLKKPKKELYLGNSGTTMRLLLGILSGQDFECVLSGDESLSGRPMKRVAEPLALMGAKITTKDDGRKTRDEEMYPPLKIIGQYPLKAIRYKSPIASAQVKSAVLLAGLYAEGITEVEEPSLSRDHTERMLKAFSAKVKTAGLAASIEGSPLKSPGSIFVPGDISSAAFFMVAASVLGQSSVRLKNTGINDTRTGIIDILKKMGARIELSSIREEGGEPVADITVYSSRLKGVLIEGAEIPRAIDELPVLMVAAVFAEGKTVIKGAGELRVKETDRIASMVGNLKKLGADIRAEGDDVIINGTGLLRGATVDSLGDHRTAMSMVIAGLKAEGKTTVLDTACINTSFPEFENILHKLV
ncbi:MAG: 3-phosphoshikimate 1-carboxyvinyltransferase [Candidatus Omnitrophica bacterium]|nr:3-phosphoshikimate 1-carboxyvinyltransferase [Candidatus Omnitrophota bacterium]